MGAAHGIRPDDNSEAAQAARKVPGWGAFNNLRFVAQLGVRPPKDGYPAKNTILKVITCERQMWKKPEQIQTQADTAATPQASPTPAAPPASAIARPQWAG